MSLLYFGRHAVAVGAFLIVPVLAAAPLPDRPKPPKGPNSNALFKEHKGKLLVTASTFFTGWEPEKVLDGDEKTSWFTASGDTVTMGTKPWIKIELPQDEMVRRVTVLGNREPSWPTGYSVLSGLLELLDKDGKVLWSDEAEGADTAHDFQFVPKRPVKGVRFIRFTSLKDEGDKSPYNDIAIAEVQAE